MKLQKLYIALIFIVLMPFQVKGYTLVIDAGHGGKDGGARGYTSWEKNINLAVALAFGKLVEQNCPDVKVVYTRSTDVFVELDQRARIANKNKADLSRMSGKKDLYLASVFHATAFEWDTDGNPFDQDIYGREELRSPKLFYADHPFIFLVRDTQSGSLLFIGRLVRPKGDKMRDEL